MRLCTCGFANSDNAVRCVACGGTLGGDGGVWPRDPSTAGAGDPSTAGLRPSAQDDAGAAGASGAARDAGTSRVILSERSESKRLPKAPVDLLLEDLRSGEVIRVPAPGGVLGRAGDFAPDLFSPRVSGVHAVVATDGKGRWTIEHTGRNASAVERGGVWSPLRTSAPQPLFGGETLKLADMAFRVRVEEACAPDAPADAPDAVARAWSVRCPVCGTEHAVAGPEDRVETCAFCRDALDTTQIARVPARPVLVIE